MPATSVGRESLPMPCPAYDATSCGDGTGWSGVTVASHLAQTWFSPQARQPTRNRGLSSSSSTLATFKPLRTRSPVVGHAMRTCSTGRKCAGRRLAGHDWFVIIWGDVPVPGDVRACPSPRWLVGLCPPLPDTRRGSRAALVYQFSGEVSTLLTIPTSPSRPIRAMRLAIPSWEQTRARSAALDVEHQRTADW